MLRSAPKRCRIRHWPRAAEIGGPAAALPPTLGPAPQQPARRTPGDTDFSTCRCPSLLARTILQSRQVDAHLRRRRSSRFVGRSMLLHTHQARPAGVVVATHGRACLLGASCRRDRVATCGNAISEFRFVAFLDDDSQILIRTLSVRAQQVAACARTASVRQASLRFRFRLGERVSRTGKQGASYRLREEACRPSCSLGGSAGHRRGLRRQRLGRGAHRATSLRTAEVPAAASEEPKSDVEEQWPAYTFAPVRLRGPSQGS